PGALCRGAGGGRPATGRVRPGAGRQPGDERGKPVAAAEQDRGALVPPRRGGFVHLLLDARHERLATVALAGEWGERLVEPAAVRVRVEIAQAGRETAAHLAVRGRVVAARKRAAAVAQREQRVELVDELGRCVAPAHR